MLAEVTGRPAVYRDQTVEEAWATRRPSGHPDWEIEGWVTSYLAIAAGELSDRHRRRPHADRAPGPDGRRAPARPPRGLGPPAGLRAARCSGTTCPSGHDHREQGTAAPRTAEISERQQYVTLRRLSRDHHALDDALPTWASPSGWGIGTKVVALAVTSVAVTGVAMVGVSAWQSDEFATDAQARRQRPRRPGHLAHLPRRLRRGVHAGRLHGGQGRLRPRRRPVRPGAGRRVQHRPPPQVGTGRLGGEEPALRRRDPAVAAPRPDRRAVAGQEQRRRRPDAGGRPDQGDDRRDGHDLPEDAVRRLPPRGHQRAGGLRARAIGTYIPVTNPDGKPNPVAATAHEGRDLPRQRLRRRLLAGLGLRPADRRDRRGRRRPVRGGQAAEPARPAREHRGDRRSATPATSRSTAAPAPSPAPS